MSEPNDLTKTSSFVSPPLPPAGVPAKPATEVLAQSLGTLPPVTTEEEARERVAALDREARALSVTEPQMAALLFHELGLIWEETLKNPRNAAVAFQAAYKLAPKFLVNIRAARRLFADVGNWQMVLQLLDAELNGTDEARQKAALLFEKATILEERLSREADAKATWSQCLELKPTEVALLTQLEAHYAARNDSESLVEVYRLLSSALETPVLRAHYLTSAGLVLEERLKQPEAAAACFREAFTLDRSDLLLLASLKRVAEREGRTDEMLAALASEAHLLGTQATPAYLQIAKIYERLGRKDDALAALLAARRVTPQEPLVLSELAGIYETQGRYEELADVLLSWVGSINDESELVAINLRLAALYEEELKREVDAIARYQAILSRIPGHASALAGMGKLYHRLQNWEGLVSVFDAEIAAGDEPKQKAARMYKAAEVMEERLGRQEDAIARYNACLQLQPGYLPAQKSLARLYERQGRFAELVAMYEQDLLQTADRDQLITTLNKMAGIYEDRLSDLVHAIDCMKRILDLASDHLPTIRNLSRLYERAGQFRELIESQELEASFAGDTKQVLSLYHRNAEILDEHLKDRAGAITVYERVLALSPSYLPALKALGRLYAQEGRWNELIKMYRAEAEIASTTEQASTLIYKIGELYEHRLKSENEAIASYQEALTLAPSYFPALRALARIYRTQNAWESLIEVLRAEAANRIDPTERANALFQAAAIWEDQLQRPELAIEGYQEVLRVAPSHAASLRALERLYVTQDNTKELVAILDRETQVGHSPGAKVAAYLKLARLYMDRFQEPTRAAQCCEAVLQLEPGQLSALKMLERIRSGDRARRAELRVRLSERVTDKRLRTALRLSAAVDQDQTLSESTLDEYKLAFQEDPADVRVSFALERAMRQAGDAAGLAWLYARRLEAVTDPYERVEITLRAADVAENRLGDLERAAQLYQSALEAQPHCLPALMGSRRVQLKQGNPTAARATLEAEARASKDSRSAVEAFIAAAKLSTTKLNDLDGAAALYRQALERDPLNAVATTGLEDLLAQRGGTADLAALHERRGEARLVKRDVSAAAAAFVSGAKLYLTALDDRTKALALVDRALSAHPSYPDALELKGRLFLDAQQYAEAASALAQRVQQGGDPRLLAQHHLTLGGLYQTYLNEPGRAAAHLQTALATLPKNVEALDRLATLHLQSRNWTGAVDCLKRLLEQELSTEDRARHTVELARVHDEGLNDMASASLLYRKALELIPGDAALVDRLVILYERAANLPELAQMLEAQATALSADPKRAQSVRLRLAELYARSLDQPARAVTVYRQVLEQEPSSIPARAALAEMYTRDSNSTPMAIEEHRQLLKLDPARVESLHALFKLWEGLKQYDKAFCASAVLQFLRSATETESVFYSEAKNRLPQEAPERLALADLDNALLPPTARGPLLEVLRAMGDQAGKLYPPQFEMLGVDRKADRLKPDSAVFKAILSVAKVFGVEEFEVYQARRGLMTLETTEPLCVCVGQDVVRKFNAREQKFLIGRAVLGLLNKTAMLSKLSQGETADLLGNSIRIFAPQFSALGRKNDEMVKQLRKAYTRKALKALELPAMALGDATKVDAKAMADGLAVSADRAGMLMCGDVSVGLGVVLREDPAMTNSKIESMDPVLAALKQRADLKELLNFSLSDDFFRMRQRLGLSL
ncbi:tetratricopeptide repeat protein [Stigmatella sp. ncwal1]|uniref:Tetratricopeptide repeat protein n=1 Tax=Stigmatella ashevillensis TaxID=2995309 RepID=A0ABT5D4D7_9BACT|nr:tetratricopeptide repeat protein [Stigmatella ashevillena]MDC0707102.1 tetratricopeptide repeat protein [Stigmatella ashevillena]